MIAIIHRAMGLQKTGSRKLDYQSFYPMHRFEARSGIAPTEHSETVFCSASIDLAGGCSCSEQFQYVNVLMCQGDGSAGVDCGSELGLQESWVPG